MMVTPYVGRKIKEIRAKKRIPQKAILEKAGLKQSYLANVETGRIKLPLLANLRKIADALGISIEALVEGTTSEQLLTTPRPSERTYCPNPDCPGGTEGLLRGKKIVVHFSLPRFDEDDEERKFCPHCKSPLIAVCRKEGCGAAILSNEVQFCSRCGDPLYAWWEKEMKERERETKK